MINLFYEEDYWRGARTLNGPKKVIDNLKGIFRTREDTLCH